MGLFWENSEVAFVLITLVIGGGAAWMTGRAVAGGWSSPLLVLGYALLLSFADRFLHYALGGGDLFSAHYWIVDFSYLLAVAGLSYRVRRAEQMTTQYFWLYERTSPIGWRPISGDASERS